MLGDYPAVESYAPVGWCPDHPYVPASPASQWSPGIQGIDGLGDSRQFVMTLPQIAGSTIATASALGAGWATAAIPIVGPAIAAVTIGLSFLWGRKGPRQKVATTEIVNKVEPLLKQNLDAYLSGPRTYSAQAQALANFDAGWKYVVDSCAIPEMGDPGKWCVSDRQAGACEWKDAQGKCWNWFVGYRDPIANDPEVKPDPVPGADLLSSVAGPGGILGGSSGLLLIAGLAIAAVFMMGGGKKGGR